MSPEELGQRNKVVEIARSWLKTPYHHMGRIKGAGVDCGMILAEVYEEAELIPHQEIGFYAADWALHRSEERYLGWLEDYVTLLDPKDNVPLPGDIILYQFGRCISHSAIVINYPTVLHSYIGMGVIYSNSTQEPLGNRVKYIARYKGWCS